MLNIISNNLTGGHPLQKKKFKRKDSLHVSNSSFHDSCQFHSIDSSISKFNNKSFKSTDIAFGGFFNSAKKSGVEKFVNGIVDNKKFHNVLKNDKFNNFLETATSDSILYEAIISFFITCSIRPLTILAMPGAKKEDKNYAASQSIASGVTGLILSPLLSTPLSKGLDNIINDANKDNINKALINTLKDSKNKKIIDELNKEEFLNGLLKEEDGKFSIDILNNKIKENSKKIDSNFKNSTNKQLFNTKIAEFNKRLNIEFEAIKKATEGKTKLSYLFHEKISLEEGGKKFAAKIGTIATNVKGRTSYVTKFVTTPLTAVTMVWLIPKIMKMAFPNHKKQNTHNNDIKQVQQQFLYSKKINNVAKRTLPNVYQQFMGGMKNNNKVAFTGAFGNALKKTGSGFKEVYTKPTSKIFQKIYGLFFENENFINKVKQSHKETKLVNGKKISKYENSFLHKNLPAIVANWGTALYITRAIKNKDIEKDRKPALCLNMALTAAFSTFAGALIKKVSKPLEEKIVAKHKELMKGKLNYNVKRAWGFASNIAIIMFCFRYLGPVVATPAADKLTKLLQNKGILKKPEDKKA